MSARWKKDDDCTLEALPARIIMTTVVKLQTKQRILVEAEERSAARLVETTEGQTGRHAYHPITT